jgi:DNA-binding transcriptional MocR family regulator
MKPQQELFQAQTTWFHVFKAMVDNGDIAKLGPYAVTVYLVIKSYTNFSTGRAFPSIETITEKSGISDKQVRRCLVILEESGYITREKRGRNYVYTLREKIEFTDKEGRPAAVATWDYLPSTIEAARAELRNFQMTGKGDGKIVNIARAVFNIQIGDNNNQTNFNVDLDKIADPELRQLLSDVMNKQK